MKKKSLLYSTIIFIMKSIFKLLYRHKVYGLEHFTSGSALIAANHTSFLDPPAVAISCPSEIHFLARQSLFKSHFGTFITALNSHPVKMESTNLQTIKEICQLLKDGYKVLIFPEGTRSNEDVIQEIKPGMGIILSRSQSAILPTYIHGTHAAWNRERKWPRLFGKTAVVFGSPLLWDHYADMDRKEAQNRIASDLKNSLQGLRQWYLSGAEGSPP